MIHGVKPTKICRFDGAGYGEAAAAGIPDNAVDGLGRSDAFRPERPRLPQSRELYAITQEPGCSRVHSALRKSSLSLRCWFAGCRIFPPAAKAGAGTRNVQRSTASFRRFRLSDFGSATSAQRLRPSDSGMDGARRMAAGRGEDRVGTAKSIKCSESFPLEIHILRQRFDDEIGIGCHVERNRRFYAGKGW